MNIGNYTLEEFLERIRSFHGSTAPGVIIGGIMVDTLKKNLPPGEFFDVICESAHCLPMPSGTDAMHHRNGWLRTHRYRSFA
jgi:formylmethanofuran dehydrogenase subunit E